MARYESSGAISRATHRPTAPLTRRRGGAERRPAVTVAGRSLDRDALYAAAGAVADRVHGAGVVAIEATASLETVVAVLGCLLAGVDRCARAARRRPARARPPPAPTRARSPCPPVDVDRPFVHVVDDRRPTARRCSCTRPGRPARRRARVLSHRAVNACLDGLFDAWEWTPDDVLAHGLPLFHVHGLVLGVLGALRAGSPLVHTGRPDARGVRRRRRPRCTSACRRCGDGSRPTRRRAGRCARRRLLVSGSAGAAAGRCSRALRGAGRAGTGRAVRHDRNADHAGRPRRRRRAGPGWVGGPIAGVETRVLADGRARSATCEVRGATLFDGYLGRRRRCHRAAGSPPATSAVGRRRPASTGSSAAPRTT